MTPELDTLTIAAAVGVKAATVILPPCSEPLVCWMVGGGVAAGDEVGVEPVLDEGLEPETWNDTLLTVGCAGAGAATVGCDTTGGAGAATVGGLDDFGGEGFDPCFGVEP